MTDREKIDMVYEFLREYCHSPSITVSQDPKQPQKLKLDVDCTFECELLIMNVKPMED